MKGQNEFKNFSLNIVNYLNTITFPKNPCVIFEIDNVLIKNCKYFEPMIDIYREIKLLNIKIILITKRIGTSIIINYTKDQLHMNDIKFDYIYFLKNKNKSIKRFKKNVIKNILEKEYNILLYFDKNNDPMYIQEFNNFYITIPEYISYLESIEEKEEIHEIFLDD
jgi:hypothetical protein